MVGTAQAPLPTLRSDWIASWSLSSGAHSRDPLARNDGKQTQRLRPLRRLKCSRDRALGLLLNLSQMLLAVKTFRVDLVDVLGAGGSCGKPSVFRHHLDAAERLIVAGSRIQRRAHRLAGKLLDGELLWRKRLQQILLRDRRGGVDPLIERHAKFAGETIE